jgi:hypothetical protein
LPDPLFFRCIFSGRSQLAQAASATAPTRDVSIQPYQYMTGPVFAGCRNRPMSPVTG